MPRLHKIISVILWIFFLFLISPSNTYAQSSDCRQEYKDWRSICEQSVTPCNECQGNNKNPVCDKACNDAVDKCIQAQSTLDACLGVDRKTWVLKPQTPGHLTCDEWKQLSILGAAQNCTDLSWQPETGGAWCSASIEEGVQRTNKVPPDYIFDFDYNACTSSASADDVRLFRKGSPLTSGSSSEVSQKTNPISKFVRDVQNYFKPPPPSKETTQPQTSQPNSVSAPAKAVNDWITETLGVFDPNKIEIVPDLSDKTVQRSPKITRKNEAELLEAAKKKQESPFWVGYLHTDIDKQPLIKYPNTNEFVPFGNLSDILPGSTIRSGNSQIGIVDNRTKGLIHIEPNSEITIINLGKDKAPVFLQQGEIEVNEQGSSNQGTGIQTDFFDLIIIGTHFWVSKDTNTKQAVVGVYEGEVQVKTKDGQNASVIPSGDKPGAVSVTQKLSTTKFVSAGLILAAVTGGVVFFLKRNFFQKQKNKRR